MDLIPQNEPIRIRVNVEFSDVTWKNVEIVKIWIDPVDGTQRFEARLPPRLRTAKTRWWQRLSME